MLWAAEAADDSNFVSFETPTWVWAAFVALIVFLVAIDLLLVHRTAHEITLREASIESAVWVSLGLLFTFVILGWQGGAAAGEYLSGYLIEESLSIDNVFVWAVILTYFGVPAMYRFRVLFWGIFGALVLRAIFIFAGVALVERFNWVLYVFGAFLIYTAWKISQHDEAEVHPDDNIALKIVRRFVPSTNEYDGQKLFTRENGKRVATPLFAVLVMIETTDVLFAVDSIPAILAVSREQFIVFSSNAFAILGLRSLYFCLAGMAGRFRYLNTGLAIILAFVGVKMLIHDIVHLPTWAGLVVIILTLTGAIVASLRADAREGHTHETAPIEEVVERIEEHVHEHRHGDDERDRAGGH